MLTNISSPAAQSSRPAQGPVELLEACHHRIRHFLEVSRALADHPQAPPAEISEAAAAVFRYFNEALRLHEADESDTLYPRLRNAAQVGESLRDAAKAMVEQHHAIDEMVSELVHFCEVIQRRPDLLPSLATQFKYVTQALQQIFEAHLNMEESVIFPAVARFPATEQEEMTREMQQRRRPPENIHLVR